MLITVSGFGSVWRRRFGKDPDDTGRYARAAYYNTTGVPVNGIVRTRPEITGHARFNAAGGFNPNYPFRMIGRVFECAEPCIWNGQNKVLFQRVLRIPARPDYFLVATRQEILLLELLQRGVRTMCRQILSFRLSDHQQLLTDADDIDLLLGRRLIRTTRRLLEQEIPHAEHEDLVVVSHR